MLACGTTTAEIKSGYGLDLDTELKMLRAIRRVGANQPVDIAATFMGAHEIPVEYRGRREDYVRLVIDADDPRGRRRRARRVVRRVLRDRACLPLTSRRASCRPALRAA